MFVRPVGAEVDPGRDRDARPLQQIVSECKAVRREARAAGVDIERALGHVRDVKPQRAQRGHQVVAPLFELRAVRFGDGEGFREEGGERRELRRCRRRDENILRELVDFAQIALGHDKPSQPPAGHVEVLGEAVDDEYVVSERERAGGLPLVHQAVVDLIDDQRSAAPPRKLHHRLEMRGRHDGAGRIRR